MKKWYTAEEAAKILSLSPGMIRKYLRIYFEDLGDEVKRVDNPGGCGYKWFVTSKGVDQLCTFSLTKPQLILIINSLNDSIDLLEKRINLVKEEKPKGLFHRLFHGQKV